MTSDFELVDAVKQGQVAAFSELVNRYQSLILRLAIRFTRDLDAAEDVVQETFIKAYRKMDSFEGRSSFKNWLYQIAINTAKNKIRDTAASDHVRLDHVQIWEGAKAESALISEDIAAQIKEAVDELPERQRIALVLRIFEDLSFKEIASIMQCPYDTAKANYRHALMKLKTRFQEIGWMEEGDEYGTSINETNSENLVEAEG